MFVLEIESSLVQTLDAAEKNSLVLHLNITDSEDIVRKVC